MTKVQMKNNNFYLELNIDVKHQFMSLKTGS